MKIVKIPDMKYNIIKQPYKTILNAKGLKIVTFVSLIPKKVPCFSVEWVTNGGAKIHIEIDT
jgi:hypothetical protein